MGGVGGGGGRLGKRKTGASKHASEIETEDFKCHFLLISFKCHNYSLSLQNTSEILPISKKLHIETKRKSFLLNVCFLLKHVLFQFLCSLQQYCSND